MALTMSYAGEIEEILSGHSAVGVAVVRNPHPWFGRGGAASALEAGAEVDRGWDPRSVQDEPSRVRVCARHMWCVDGRPTLELSPRRDRDDDEDRLVNG